MAQPARPLLHRRGDDLVEHHGDLPLARWGNRRPVRTYIMPVGAIHFGMVVALVAASTASIYDLSTKRDLRFPEDFDKPISFPWGYEVSVSIEREGWVRDGGRGSGEWGAFEAVGEISWRRFFDGETVQRAEGAARYRDLAPPPPAGLGSVRLMCEILDYRYARTLSGDSQIIDPFIHRGLWRDVQVWLPAIEYQRAEGAGEEDLSALRLPTTVPLVLKVYPMMTWMWVGLGCVLIGAGIILIHAFGRGPSVRDGYDRRHDRSLY